MTEIVAADIGGTHARFAIAEVADGRVIAVGEPCTLQTSAHASLQTAWEEFARRTGRPLPQAAAIAVAAPIDSDVLKMTNNSWLIQPPLIAGQLGLTRHVLINDFGAMGHAVAQLGADALRYVCGPEGVLPEEGVTSIVGPGTGLGVGQLLRRGGRYHVIETEGGHIDFAPLDDLEDAILRHLRQRFTRVSVERIASGPGLANIHEALAVIEQRPVESRGDKALWEAATGGSDSLAAAALERLCLSLGAFAGDIALAQGANLVVIAGGLGLRLADHLPRSGFASRFVAKGRYERLMAKIPVRLITHPQPGLFGAAAAFAQRYGD